MRVEAQIGLDLFARGCFLPEPVVDARHGHVRFRVGAIETGCFVQFDDSGFRAAKILKYGAQLEMNLRKIRCKADGLTQICFSFCELVQKLEGDRQV